MAISPSIPSAGSMHSAASKKKENAAIFLILVLLLLIIVAYFGFKFKPADKAGEVGVVETPAVRERAFTFEAASFDVGFMKTDKFKELKIFGENPVRSEGAGKAEPFVIF